MKPKLGFTFSHKQAEIMGLNPLRAFETCISWPIEYIRLGTYWSEVELQSGNYDFKLLNQLLKLCQQNNKKLILTLGVKSPRWPEFYFPKYIKPDLSDPHTKNKLFDFIEYTVKTFQNHSCISHWQVENEPLDPSGPDKAVIPFNILKQEVDLVRSLDKRPIILSVWGNDLTRRKVWKKIEPIADIIGLDLYYKQFIHRILGRNLYRGPIDSDEQLSNFIKKSSKPVWIMELQAEPWEHIVDGWRLEHTGSINPTQLRSNIKRTVALNPEVILFWGVEYWLYKIKQGNNSYPPPLVFGQMPKHSG